jgi:hypothetical protein
MLLQLECPSVLRAFLALLQIPLLPFRATMLILDFTNLNRNKSVSCCVLVVPSPTRALQLFVISVILVRLNPRKDKRVAQVAKQVGTLAQQEPPLVVNAPR